MAIQRVLLVDDEPDIRRLGEFALRAVAKWQVLLAAGGAEAVELAARERPDVILLDVMMPRIDGPATLALLRENPATARIPVVFLTASPDTEPERFHRLGACGVIGKPFDPLQLGRRVAELVGSTAAAPAGAHGQP